MHGKNILGEIDTYSDNAHDISPPDGLDENDTFHLGTFEAACGNFTAPSGRGSPFHSLGTPMHPTGIPATADELIVNETIFGACNHLDWTEFRDKFDQRLLVCIQCGEEFHYSTGGWLNETPSASPSEFLQSAVRKYSEDDVLASLVVRTVEAAGWSKLLRHDGDTHTCTFSRAGVKFASKSLPTRAAAICEAAAKLGASGSFSKAAHA